VGSFNIEQNFNPSDNLNNFKNEEIDHFAFTGIYFPEYLCSTYLLAAGN
jgi:hypothetical protein